MNVKRHSRLQNNLPAQAPSVTNRRTFLQMVTATTGATLLGSGAPVTASTRAARALVDVNVTLGRWPMRRVPCDEPEQLAAKLRAHGVTQAWAGTFEALLSKDLGSVNDRLAEACRGHGRGLFLPFGSINPKSPDWERELRRCVEIHRMRGIRLYPNYHGYRLEEPEFASLLKQAAQYGLIVQLAIIMEDERMMHPLLRVDPVNVGRLAEVIRQIPGLRLVLLNAWRSVSGESLKGLMAAGNVSTDIAMLEGVAGVEKLLERSPANRILFGSYAPLFYFESAELKLRESMLSEAHSRAVRHENAQRLLV